MEKIRLAIVGCGGMGHRHLFGLAQLHRAGQNPFDLVGACDPVRASAESLAQEAESRLGQRPHVVSSLSDLAKLDVVAVDITTTPPYHHSLAIEALAAGWHAMIEKPVGLTVRAANKICQAQAETDLVVSVAENYRRDPINRLAKALLEAGAIGTPRFLMHQTLGGRDLMLISVWRHQKNQSGVLLDVGVHYADMMEYFLGEIDTVYAQTRLHEKIRKNPAASGEGSSSNPAGVYEQWQREMPPTFEATAEDAAYATLTFKNGAVGQYIEEHATHGQAKWQRLIYGSQGSLNLPQDRRGAPISLNLGGDKIIDDGSILDLVPDFQLDSITSQLFGGDRLWRYDLPFPEIDSKLIAVEYADFAQAISGEGPVEVDAQQGTRSVAVSYAILESGLSGQKVTLEAVLNEEISAYQKEIDEGLGL